MAIGRRDILKLGVSYGTGVINFNNDSIAYDRALRKLPENNLLSVFLSEMEKAEENAAALWGEAAETASDEAAETEGPAETCKPVGAETVETNETAKAGAAGTNEAAETENEVKTSPTNEEQPASNQTPPAENEASEDVNATPDAAEEPHENPLNNAIAAAENFREFCSEYALSSLYVQMSALIETMKSECLPAVEEIACVKSAWAAIVDYVQHH